MPEALQRTKSCLKCGHSGDVAEEQPIACDKCGAIYAKVEATLARGETIRSTALPTVAPRKQRRPVSTVSTDDRPGLMVSIVIAIGFSMTLFVSLAGLAIFGMIMTVPGDGNGKAWSAAFTTAVHSLRAGWVISSVVSLGLSMARRPWAGVLVGMGSGVLGAIISGTFFL